jgi:hypothetical protein
LQTQRLLVIVTVLVEDVLSALTFEINNPRTTLHCYLICRQYHRFGAASKVKNKVSALLICQLFIKRLDQTLNIVGITTD